MKKHLKNRNVQYKSFIKRFLKNLGVYWTIGKVRCLEMVIFRPGRCRLVCQFLFLVLYLIFSTHFILQAEGLESSSPEGSGSENSENSENSEKRFGWEGAVLFIVSALAVLISQASLFGGGGGEDAILASFLDSLFQKVQDSAVPDFDGGSVQSPTLSSVPLLQEELLALMDCETLPDNYEDLIVEYLEKVTKFLQRERNFSSQFSMQMEVFCAHIEKWYCNQGDYRGIELRGLITEIEKLKVTNEK